MHTVWFLFLSEQSISKAAREITFNSVILVIKLLSYSMVFFKICQ